MGFSVKFNKNDKDDNGEKINNVGVEVGIDEEKISVDVVDEKHSNANFHLESDMDTIKKGIDTVKTLRGKKSTGKYLLGEFPAGELVDPYDDEDNDPIDMIDRNYDD